jgi:hypothetical protein
MVSDIQAQLARDLKNIDTEAQNAYKAEMIRLGLDSNKYPLQTSLDFLDHQAVTPILETVGKVAGTMTNVGKGIFNRIGQGFKTATK